MTSIEWLVSRIYVLIPDDIGSQLMFKSNIKKAKEMDKKQMIKFTNDYLDDDRDMTAEQYYNTIFENKENQKQLVVEIMEEDSKDGLYDTSLQECVNCNEQKKVHSMCLDCCIKLGNQNQTEISDEEIEKIINPNKLDKIPESWKSFIDGAKWYREQLKQKQ